MTRPSLSKQNALTHEELRQYLRYDSTTGKFIRLAGRAAGKEIAKGPRATIIIRGRAYLCHRLAWFYVHGTWPAQLMDHINGDPCDNRLCNLREATTFQNSHNRRPQTARPLKGITLTKRGKWQAQIRENRKNIYLGVFMTPDEAAAAYDRRAAKVQGEFQWHS